MSTKNFEANIGRTLIKTLKVGGDHKMVVTGVSKDRMGNLVYDCFDQDGYKPTVSVDFADRHPGHYRWAAAGQQLGAEQSDDLLPSPNDPGFSAAVAKRARGNQSVSDVLATMSLIRAGAPEADIQRSAASWINGKGPSTAKNVSPVANPPETQSPASDDPRALDAAVNGKQAPAFQSGVEMHLRSMFGVKPKAEDKKTEASKAPASANVDFGGGVERALRAKLGVK